MTVNSTTIRKLEVSDLPKLCRLLETRDELDHDGAKIRTRLMEWVAFHNPTRQHNETTYYIIEEKEKIIAFHGRMPTAFNDRGEIIKGYYVHDLYVDPIYRKKGMGFWITIALAKEIEEKSDSIFCLFGMTPLNLQMQRRRGYFETAAPAFDKILNPHRQLRKYLKFNILVSLLNPILSFGLKVIDLILLNTLSSNGKTFQVERFDQRFEEFNRKCMKHIGFSTNRSIDYLNWKYIDRPYKREVIYGLEANGEIKGYIVLGLTPYGKANTGRIIDILANPNDTKALNGLYKCAILHFKALKVHQISCILSDSRFIKSIKKFLFLKKPGKTLMLGNLEKKNLEVDRIKNVSNWHITYGESDAYMLNT